MKKKKLYYCVMQDYCDKTHVYTVTSAFIKQSDYDLDTKSGFISFINDNPGFIISFIKEVKDDREANKSA